MSGRLIQSAVALPRVDPDETDMPQGRDSRSGLSVFPVPER
jgi:hypothetical protein